MMNAVSSLLVGTTMVGCKKVEFCARHAEAGMVDVKTRGGGPFFLKYAKNLGGSISDG